MDWKRHPVTQQVFSQLQSRISGLKDELVGHALAGESESGAAKAGAILALEDILSIDYEESHGN